MIETTCLATITHDGIGQGDVTLRWSPDLPLAVDVSTPDLSWSIPRDLLIEKDAYPFGEVKAFFGPNSVVLYLPADKKKVVISIRKADINRFLAKTLKEVPKGKEPIDIDALIERCLA